MAWPQTNLSCFIYNGKRYNVYSSVYCVFRIMLQLDRKDTWRAAPTLVARTYGDACFHQELGVGRTKTAAFNRQPRVGKLLRASISWWRNLECIWGLLRLVHQWFLHLLLLVLSVLCSERVERWEMRVSWELEIERRDESWDETESDICIWTLNLSL